MTSSTRITSPSTDGTHVPVRMRAVTQDRYGDTDVLRLADVAVPTPGQGEVLVRVHAAGVDRGVWHLMTGLPYLTRLLFGLTRPRDAVPGMDLAGVVVAVAEDVTDLAPGDRVFGIGRGTYAEYAIAPAAKLARLPEEVSFEAGAVTPISGMTALQALTDVVPVRAGDRVLVIGASGGVGGFAVQVAKARGAHVTGVASAAKADLVRSLGADDVLDHAAADYLDGSATYDVVVDTGGLNPVRRLRRALTRTGSLVIVGGEGGGRFTGGFGRGLRAMAISPFVSQTLRMMMNRERREDLETLAQHLVAGTVAPAVHQAYPLAEAPAALDDLVAGRVGGKAVVVVRDTPTAPTA